MSSTDNMQPHIPNNNEVDKILSTYFLKKGYSAAELAFIKESSDSNIVSLEQLTKKLNTSPQLPSHIKLIQQDNINIDATVRSFDNLRQWIFNALDLYKKELQSVLYPMFVHSFLDLVSKGLIDHAKELFTKYKDDHPDHKNDLQSLSTINSTNIKDNAVATLYLTHKYNLRLSSIPYELFLQFLEDNKYINLIRITNHHLHIHVVTGKLTPVISDQAEGIILEEFHEIDATAIEDTEINVKKEIETMELEEMSSVPFRGGVDIQAELDSLTELRKRVSIGNTALPSICIYTFHNTHDLLNCLAISQDTTLVAGGFSESYIKVWSLKGQPLQSESEREEGIAGTKYKKLIGHAGPVYGISFSHDNKYLISCSEDQTVRLWSLETYKNLVCYKSHNYPVWDIDFGPYGFYFATASHDKTARLWSCDHINPLRIFAGHLSDVNTVRFHPNSKYIVTGSSDRTARLWDVQRGTCVRVFTGHTGSVHTVAVSPNGRLMASAGEDKTVIVWDLGTGKKLKMMTGHTGFVYSVNFNAESTVLVSGSADGTVRCWDVLKNTAYDIQAEDSTKRSKYEKNKAKDKKEDKVKDIANKRKKGNLESDDHLAVFPTKNTPIYTVQFTERNLCLAAGAISPPSSLDL